MNFAEHVFFWMGLNSVWTDSLWLAAARINWDGRLTAHYWVELDAIELGSHRWGLTFQRRQHSGAPKLYAPTGEWQHGPKSLAVRVTVGASSHSILISHISVSISQPFSPHLAAFWHLSIFMSFCTDYSGIYWIRTTSAVRCREN